jgi:uncharacterized membrane protein YhaH (DUF805 family)
MESLALFFSTSGSLARKPFAIGAVLVYVLIVLSQALLSPIVTAYANVAPFALMQAALTYVWYALHAKRLRDAGHGAGAAFGLAVLYAMSVVLFLLLVALVLGVSMAGSKSQGGDLATIVLVFFLVALFTGDPGIGLFFYLATAIMVLIALPLLIALCFSVWAGTRPQASKSVS